MEMDDRIITANSLKDRFAGKDDTRKTIVEVYGLIKLNASA